MGHVEEYELDEGSNRPAGTASFVVTITIVTGNVTRTNRADSYPSDPVHQSYGTWDDDGPVYASALHLDRSAKRLGKVWVPTLEIQCWARDFDHAIKIATEKRQEWLVTHPIETYLEPPKIQATRWP